MDEPENGEEMELRVFIANVLENVLEGVLLAQGGNVPAGLPEGVEFRLSLEHGEVEFVVPLSRFVFDNRAGMVTYSYGSKTRN